MSLENNKEISTKRISSLSCYKQKSKVNLLHSDFCQRQPSGNITLVWVEPGCKAYSEKILMSWEASQAAQADCFALSVVWFVEGSL